MVCGLFGAEPVPKPMLNHCQLVPWRETSVELESKYIFHARKCFYIHVVCLLGTAWIWLLEITTVWNFRDPLSPERPLNLIIHSLTHLKFPPIHVVGCLGQLLHYDATQWKHFPREENPWPFVRRIHSTHKGQWHGALMYSLMYSLICAWTNGWANTRDAGNLKLNWLIMTSLQWFMEINQTSIRIRTWINEYILLKQWNIITHPCPNFSGVLVKPPLKLGHGWVIISHIKQWVSYPYFNLS